MEVEYDPAHDSQDVDYDEAQDGVAGNHSPVDDESDHVAVDRPPMTVRRYPHSLRIIYEPTITIYLGQEIQQIPQSQFLQHVWGDGLDSNCHECGYGFSPDDDPIESMIRTIAFEKSENSQPSGSDITQTSLTVHPIRIYNRHFRCLKEKAITYIPISHAWHLNVSKFQNDHLPGEDVAHDFEVARAVYQTPLRTLQAVTMKFGPVEIWHDYLSVPQWQPQFQRQLLLAIPDIYSWPERTAIHLDDVSAKALIHVQKNPEYGLFLDGLSEVTRSRWFERMWVTLEYMKSNEVRILTQDWEVFGLNASLILDRVDAAISKYIKQKGDATFHDHANEKGCKYDTKVCWTDMETWKMRKEKHRTLGFAIHILGQKKCRDMKDYHYALAGMIGFHVLKWRDPNDDSRRFWLLVKAALRHGDYTPLLFTPVQGEQPYDEVPWLHGHSRMTEKVWDLGACHQKAASSQIWQNGHVSPELEEVGVIESWKRIDVDGDPKVLFWAIVRWVLHIGATSARAFCNAVDRIFTDFESTALYVGWSSSETSEQGWNSPRYDIESIETILKSLKRVLRNSAGLWVEEVEDNEDEVDTLIQDLINVMNLESRGKNSADSRLNKTFSEIEWYRKQYGSTFDGVAQVRCNSCQRRSLFRLVCWTKPRRHVTEVFRIPGLLFDETVPQGVGLVITDGRIIGKMSYGTPACGCHKSRTVEII
ncbi:hypothetical protein BP6252_06785 [Coleophoma cylindrospora]|uniref:Heterokaryon incompatibility domain-containing protein n=1 Tax=Coleophoma cylindrospora TaxID=1849047 RepID=A0A3D8RG13_9HELO|nr:hypothetical protein BP6252_06785 [Coleophoma cylindrospora]